MQHQLVSLLASSVIAFWKPGERQVGSLYGPNHWTGRFCNNILNMLLSLITSFGVFTYCRSYRFSSWGHSAAPLSMFQTGTNTIITPILYFRIPALDCNQVHDYLLHRKPAIAWDETDSTAAVNHLTQITSNLPWQIDCSNVNQSKCEVANFDTTKEIAPYWALQCDTGGHMFEAGFGLSARLLNLGYKVSVHSLTSKASSLFFYRAPPDDLHPGIQIFGIAGMAKSRH